MQDFAANCLTCHLEAEPRPGAEYARFTGCAACHTPEFAPPLAAAPVQNPGGIHRLTTAIPYTQCNTCHNRGNYSLRDLQFHARADQPSDRRHDYYQPIAQFTKCEYELDCVDCHTNGEAMGDGDLHSSKSDVQYLQCRDCHGTLSEPPRTQTLTDPNDLALRLARLNPVIDLKLGDTILVSSRGEPLWNVRRESGGVLAMTGKVTRATYVVPLVQGSACEQKPDEQSSAACHACHAVER
jgi:hypothetical protein